MKYFFTWNIVYLLSKAATVSRVAVSMWSSWMLLSDEAFEGAALLVQGVSWRGEKTFDTANWFVVGLFCSALPCPPGEPVSTPAALTRTCMSSVEGTKLATCPALSATTWRQTSGVTCLRYHNPWQPTQEPFTMARYIFQASVLNNSCCVKRKPTQNHHLKKKNQTAEPQNQRGKFLLQHSVFIYIN